MQERHMNKQNIHLFRVGEFVLIDPVPKGCKRPKKFKDVEAVKGVVYKCVDAIKYTYQILLIEDCWKDEDGKYQKKGELYYKIVK